MKVTYKVEVEETKKAALEAAIEKFYTIFPVEDEAVVDRIREFDGELKVRVTTKAQEILGGREYSDWFSL